MAKRKDLLLNESTVSRMMGLAGIGALTNPFLREERNPDENVNHGPYGDQEEEMEESWHKEEEMDEMMGHGYEEEDEGMLHGLHDEEEYDDEEDEEEYEDEEDEEEYDDEEDDEEEDLEEAKKPCSKCGEIHEGSSCGSSYMQESVRRSMKRLKKLLEQAEAGAEPPAPGGKDVPPPEPAPGGEGGDVEEKIKEFVKKLGELVQETLGVEVTVEEGEGEPEMPEGGAGAPPPPAEAAPAPMAEAINRLVNKVARRVKARLMEAKGEKDKAIETKRKMAAKGKEQMKMKALKEKQAAAKKKEMDEKKAKLMKEKQMAAKKKEMEMKKKKAEMAKKK